MWKKIRCLWAGLLSGTMLAGAALLLGGCAGSASVETAGDAGVSGNTETEQRIPVSETELKTVYAEETDDRTLAGFLTSYYQIPEEELSATRYYYNKVDLDGDGSDETIAVVVGEYTACDGGDPALILQEADGGYTVVSEFAYVRTPVYISDTETDGWHDLIFCAYGGDEGTGFRLFRFSGEGGYSETEFLEELPDDFSGEKILANNFIDDMDKGNYLTLAGE